MGCSAVSGLVSLPAAFRRSSRVLLTSALVELLTPISPSSVGLQPVRQRLVGHVLVGEHGVAAIGRNLARQQHAAHRRDLEVGGVGVPEAAEVVALVLELDHRRDERRFGQAVELRILDQLAELAGEGHVLLRRHLLVAQEDHEMVEEGLAHLGDHVVLEIARHVDAVQLGAQGAGDRPDLDMAIVAHRRSLPLFLRAYSEPRRPRLGHEMPDALRRLRPAQQADQALGGIVEHGAIIPRGSSSAPDA